MEGGERPHLALTMSLKDFQAQRGAAEGWSRWRLRRCGGSRCDAKVLRLVLGAKSEPLDIGRATRTIPNQIRRGADRPGDQGCAFPGCHRRPGQCHAHHVRLG